MSHYRLDQWVDFTRGVATVDDRREIQNHLTSGCDDCRNAERFYRKLAVICERLGAAAAPEQAVQRAKAIFPAGPQPWPKRALRIPIQLIYDSFLIPAPVGLRSSWQVGWQGLFHAGDCSVDLRIEPELRSSRASVIGQISNHEAPEAEMGDIPVCLKAGKEVVAQTRSNRFGEFQMDYQQQGRLLLCIYLEGGKRCIQVPLKKLAADKPFRVETEGRLGEPHKDEIE